MFSPSATCTTILNHKLYYTDKTNKTLQNLHNRKFLSVTAPFSQWAKKMKKKLLFFALSLSLLLMCTSYAQATLIDDAYHFDQFTQNPNVGDYAEWWFFSFNSPIVNGLIQYSLWDPTGAGEFSFGLMYVSLQNADGTLDVFYPIPWQFVTTSTSSADLAIGPESISVNSGVYTIAGYVEDEQGNTVAWNLQYIQQVDSLSGIRNLVTAPDEAMNWYVQMPKAVVNGEIIVNGQTIEVNGATGYHDHNWGVWKLSDTVWNWFETSTADLTIVGYDFYALNQGQITVQFGDQAVTFQKNEYRVLNRDWTSFGGLPFPQRTIVLASNGEYRLVLNIKVSPTETGVVAREYPTALWVVLDSSAVFNGVLVGPDVTTSIHSVGFREYALDVPL